MEIIAEDSVAALPAYAGTLAAYQRAHAPELRAMVADLPLPRGGRVLDLACGAGVYACWLAERVGPGGEVVGLDIDPAFLAQAAAQIAAAGLGGRVRLERGDCARLPFADDSFDLVWCAQSLDTLPDPQAALREMCRVVRPGGAVAVFENDALHQVILPWPAELELAVRAAQLRSFATSHPRPERFYLARDFAAAMREAGFAHCRVAAYPSVRQAPLSADERRFLDGYLAEVAERALGMLPPEQRRRFMALADPGSPECLLNDPDLLVTYLDFVALGVKGGAGSSPTDR